MENEQSSSRAAVPATPPTPVAAAKAEIRRRVWRRLIDHGVGLGSVVGSIPNFVGSDAAADRLAPLPEWQTARTVMANPDWAQEPVRRRALLDGKLLFMAVPGLAGPDPFYRLDPATLGADVARAADRHVAARLAPTVSVTDMPLIDLIVCGSVAVNYEGVRIGKGAGYSDREIGMLAEAGLVTSETKIVTTVHELQVVDEVLPEEGHDYAVDWVVTGEGVVRCSRQDSS
ncbi:MAG: 5-formyltetrahydrofolate cyclo-ligase [Pseudonocardia sp.]